MGVIKNDVGRPSNKTIRTRFIIRLLVILLVLLAVGAAYYMGTKKDNNKSKEKNQTENKENKVDEALAKSLFEKYNVFNNWLDIYTNENIKFSSEEEAEKELKKFSGKYDFSYFYNSDKITKVSDEMKYAISIGNLFLKKIDDELGSYNSFDMGDKEIDFEVINKKSKELFGEGININNLLYGDYIVVTAGNGNNCKYDKTKNTIKPIGGGIGDGGSEDFYTKIINTKKVDNNIEIYNKVMHVSYTPNDEDSYYISSEALDLGNIKNYIDKIAYQKLNEKSMDSLIDTYEDKLYTYKWTFTENEKGNYIFKSVEKVK